MKNRYPYQSARGSSKSKCVAWIAEFIKLALYSSKMYCLGALAGALAILCLTTILSYAPSPFVSYRLEQDGFLLLSDKPISANSGILLSRVRDIIARSELYRDEMKFRVYLCNRSWLYFITSCFSSESKGVYTLTTGRIAIDMNKITGKNDFVNCISHEAVHSMTRSHFGWRIILLPTWVKEGYAEYIANMCWSTRNAQVEIESIKAGGNGDESYRRHWMLVSYALDVWKIPLDDLFRRPPATKEIMFAMQSQTMAWLISNIVGKREENHWFQRSANDLIINSI